MSHPSWVCGLKPGRQHDIEYTSGSHPSWVCGLKHKKVITKKLQTFVTPFVGVWIETHFCLPQTREEEVTPFVGVWIETRKV